MSLPPIGPAGLPARGQEVSLQQTLATLNQPVAIAYGRHVVGGNLIAQEEASGSGPTTLLFAHGEGEWEGPVIIWVNGIELDHTDTTKYHFHPGLDGENADESDPATRNQKICSFFPAVLPRLNFNRTAYSAFSLPQDPYSPTAGFNIRAIYDCLKVGSYDGDGGLVAYEFSDNPAWCALDLLLRRFLMPDALIAAALPAAVKARIDFPAWVGWALECDELITIPAGKRGAGIGTSVKRWTSNCAFIEATDLMRALELLLMTGRGYLIEKNGKFAGLPDMSRGGAVVVFDDRIVANSFTAGSINLRSAANQFAFAYRHINSGGGAGSGDMAKDFQPQTKIITDEEHQDRTGRVLRYSVDLGNAYPDEAERLAKFHRARTLDYPRTASLKAMEDTPGLRDVVAGDLVSAPRRMDASAGLSYQVASHNPFTRELKLQEHSDDIFSDEVDDV